MDILGGVSRRVGQSSVWQLCTGKGSFCKIEISRKRKLQLRLSFETVRCGILDRFVWSSDDFWIAFRSFPGLPGMGPDNAILTGAAFATEETAVSSIIQKYEE